MNREHLANFYIAGFTYYDGTQCFYDLKIGTALKMVLETNNGYDPRAVAVYFKDFKLGYVPRSDNRIIYKLLKLNLDIMDIRIQALDTSQNPEVQVKAVVHLINVLAPQN